jgi:hypothetical protein
MGLTHAQQTPQSLCCIAATINITVAKLSSVLVPCFSLRPVAQHCAAASANMHAAVALAGNMAYSAKLRSGSFIILGLALCGWVLALGGLGAQNWCVQGIPGGLLSSSSSAHVRLADKAASINAGMGHFSVQYAYQFLCRSPGQKPTFCCACFSAPSGWSALTLQTQLQTSLLRLQLAPLSQPRLLHPWPTLWARMLPSAHVPGSGSGESTMPP